MKLRYGSFSIAFANLFKRLNKKKRFDRLIVIEELVGLNRIGLKCSTISLIFVMIKLGIK